MRPASLRDAGAAAIQHGKHNVQARLLDHCRDTGPGPAWAMLVTAELGDQLPLKTGAPETVRIGRAATQTRRHLLA